MFPSFRRSRGCLPLLAAFLWVAVFAAPREAQAASVGTARVSVFKHGTTHPPPARAVGSLIGVWNFRGRTFSTQYSNHWQRQFDNVTGNTVVAGLGLWKSDPSYGFGAGDRFVGRFTGTTWLIDVVQNLSQTVASRIGIATSSFAVVGQDFEDLWQWSGTSWLHRITSIGSASAPRFTNVSVLATNYAFAFTEGINTTLDPTRAVWHWRGTSWRVHLRQLPQYYGIGGMVATDYGWYLAYSQHTDGLPYMYRWLGTSWLTYDLYADVEAGDWNVFGSIPGARDFAVMAGDTGALRRWSGTSWLKESGITSQDYRAGVAVRTDWMWLVGNAGTLLQWTGTSWRNHGEFSAANFLTVASVDTDYAIVGGTSGACYVWRGTSWILETTTESRVYLAATATSGKSFTVAAGQNAFITQKQHLNIIDDSSTSDLLFPFDWEVGTIYRTVVQIMPTDSDWDWTGTSTNEGSYMGVINKGGTSYEFYDEQDNGTESFRRIVLETDSPVTSGSGTQEDILIWEDTVGWWDGHSDPHNLNASSGIKLLEAGQVHNDAAGALPADIWGETDSRITPGGAKTWEAATGSDTTVTANTGVLTWEYWHMFPTGFGEGEDIEAAIHVKAGGTSTDLAGISWMYRNGNFRPRIADWRWCRDNAAEPEVMKEPRGRLPNVVTTGERLRLRVRIDETDGGWITNSTGAANGVTFWYSTDQATWTQITTSSSVWKFVDGQGTAGGAVTTNALAGVDTFGINVESSTGTNGFRQEPFTEVEHDFSIESSAAASGTTYYFEVRHRGHRCLPVPGVEYPALATTDDATYNFLYTRPELGRMSRPLVNPAIASGGNGDAFKVVYVGTQGGSGDQLFAISRTNGGLVRSYSASGTLEHGNLYWDSTNTRYNLFFRQGNSSILALTDDGGTITTNASWASNPLDMVNLVGRPVRFFDGDRQNYLMLLVTSFQGNTSTLYKLRASDSTIVTDGNYSQSALAIGYGTGLRVSAILYPLWVEGTAYVHNTGLSASVKIPQSGGTTPTSGANTIAAFPITYTRHTITTGGRILISVHAVGGSIATETTWRINDAGMAGADWGATGIGSDVDDGDTLQSSPFSPPFQSAFPVPVYLGDSAQINRLAGSNGTQEANFPYTLTGSVNTEIMIKGDWIYFGTDEGYIYALSGTDPSQGAGTRFEVPGRSTIVGVALDSTNSIVYYTTRDGRIYQFDTR